MAAIGKIRSWGTVLVCVIGLALFAFIAEELARSTDSMRNDSRQQVGEVLGKKISVQEFQALLDEYQQVIKMTQGRDNLSEEELNQVKDMVWNTYVQTSIIEKEAEELGLTVTDQELQNILKEGTNPLLAQTPFVNQQTGRFDANMLKKFLADYKQLKNTNPQAVEQYEIMYKYWTFIEKTLRQQTLSQKYQALFAGCLLSNPVEAKMAFKDENEEASATVAAFPYSSVKENEAKVEESDIKAKYEELKEMFAQIEETRDIKFVAQQVTASAADRSSINKQVNDFASQLATADDPTEIVRKSMSQVTYLGLPQSKEAFPQDIAQRLDSIAVGSVTAPVENKADNTINVIRLYSKQQMPDSIQFRVIQVGAETAEAASTKADSIYNAVNGGADFEALAKKYGQTGEKTWLTGAQYEHSATMDKDSKTYLSTVTTLGEKAFFKNNNLKSIYIPDSVTSIGDSIVNKNTVIYGGKGSAAEKYANENECSFVETKLGDANLDGNLTIADTSKIQRYIAQFDSSLDKMQLQLADYNHDGVVDIHDATDIQRTLAGIK